MGALQRHGTRKPHWVPFPQSTRSRSTSEVERPIPVSSWGGRFRVPLDLAPDWIGVCASEALHLPGGEDRLHVEHLLACLVELLGEHVAAVLASGSCERSTRHRSLSTCSVVGQQLLFDRLHLSVE